MSFILVSVETKLVMVGGSVLPLAERLDTEKFHECTDFNFRELFTQLAVTDEVPVFLNSARNMSILALDLFVHSVLLFSNGEIVVVLLRVFIFPFISITFALFSSFFFFFSTIVSIVILSFLITIVCWVLFFFYIGETAFNESLPSR